MARTRMVCLVRDCRIYTVTREIDDLGGCSILIYVVAEYTCVHSE